MFSSAVNGVRTKFQLENAPNLLYQHRSTQSIFIANDDPSDRKHVIITRSDAFTSYFIFLWDTLAFIIEIGIRFSVLIGEIFLVTASQFFNMAKLSCDN